MLKGFSWVKVWRCCFGDFLVDVLFGWSFLVGASPTNEWLEKKTNPPWAFCGNRPWRKLLRVTEVQRCWIWQYAWLCSGFFFLKFVFSFVSCENHPEFIFPTCLNGWSRRKWMILGICRNNFCLAVVHFQIKVVDSWGVGAVGWTVYVVSLKPFAFGVSGFWVEKPWKTCMPTTAGQRESFEYLNFQRS